MDIKYVRDQYIKGLEEKLIKAKVSYEIAKKDTIEAEGRMVTRYDSTKTETAWLADGYLKDVKELESMIGNLESKTEYVNIGDQIQLDKFINGEYKGNEVLVIEPELLQLEKMISCIGLHYGDSFTLRENGSITEYQLRKIDKRAHEESAGLETIVSLVCDDEVEHYYLVNYIGGIEFECDGQEVYCVSKQSPIAQQLLGCMEGQEIYIGHNADIRCKVEKILHSD